MPELNHLTAAELSSLIRSGEVSAMEAAKSCLDQIDRLEPELNSLLTVTRDTALAQAALIDQSRRDGQNLPPLAGVPMVLKDNICTRDIRTTCGSKILPNFVPPYDATVTNKLRTAGAILVGKANCDEFAMGSSTENSAYGPSKNPWDTNKVPGGSSGGSAVAVAARQAHLGLGSDTGGSIRQPASLCGIVGLKPTYGRVSRFGLVAYASSLDQIGPMTRTVEDCALVMNAISGRDVHDSTSIDVEVPDFTANLNAGISGLRIGIPREYFGSGVDPEIADLVNAAIKQLCDAGAIAEECSLPSTEYGLASYYIIAPAEASSNLARYDGVKYGHRTALLSGHIGLTEKSRDEGFGDEVKQRIMIGTYALSAGYYDAFYKKAQQVRTIIRRDFDSAFEKYDVLLTPTSPVIAFNIGERASDPLAMKLADVCTIPVNLAGLPAVSIPCGFVKGMPVGLQIIGKPFDEATILRTASAYEQLNSWYQQRPAVC